MSPPSSPSSPPPAPLCYGLFFAVVAGDIYPQEMIYAPTLYFMVAIPIWLAEMSIPANRPALFWLLWLLHVLPFCAFLAPATANWFIPGCIPAHLSGGDNATADFIPFFCGVLMLCLGLYTRRKTLIAFRMRIKVIEGGLTSRLEDGSLRLLRVAWLRARPSDWVLQRRQDLPEEAFFGPADAVRLLEKEKVAALSYKWQGPFNSSKGGGDQPDGSRFHLNKVLSYYQDGRHEEERPALMWDFAALPQHDPITGAKRADPEDRLFKKGLSVMSNAYASPRVLVLQHKRILPELEKELRTFGGNPPADRLDLIPYEGDHCRSGWCTSESACAQLMTTGGGHSYELGVGKVPVAPGRLPTVPEMDALFNHSSTRFIGNADRSKVSKGYLELRAKLEAYDEEHTPAIVRAADTLMTGYAHGDDGLLRVIFYLSMLVPTSWPILLDRDFFRAQTAASDFCLQP